MPELPAALWAARAYVDGRMREAVRLEVSAEGTWATVQSGATRAPGLQQLDGLVLPGLVNAHSHAFQRAFAGLTEQRESAQDDFWSWRDRMYRVALRMDCDQLQAVATQLYAELLRGGYTHVCEFHYLHRAVDSTRCADELTMTHALVRAAERVGIGLTLLPAVYERAGFGEPGLREAQRRFAAGVDDVLRWRDAVRAQGKARVLAGVALHSVRAVWPRSMIQLARRCADDPGPIHIHVAEQTGEVDACVKATGMRPIAWLAQHVGLDERWQLVHATHATPSEIDAVAHSGAAITLCPSTEANLGDGLCDLPGWLGAAVPIAIGSDSQITRHWREELRWLEYGQRLRLQRRNVAAAPEAGVNSSAQRLFDAALAAGGRAAGFPRWGLQVGAPADLLVVGADTAALRAVPADHLLDALVFSSPAEPFRDVMVGGRWVARADAPADAARVADFANAMAGLHAQQAHQPH